MSLHWLSCPHCKVLSQFDAAGSGAPRQCPACKRPVPQTAVSVPASAASSAGRPNAAPAAPGPGWFYAQNKKKHGPVQLTQLRQLASSGKLQPSDMVLQEGSGKWLAASALPELFPVPAPRRPASSPNGSPAPVPTSALPRPVGWYYVKEKKKYGPVSREQLGEMAFAGQIIREDMVLPPGGAKWLPAGSVDGLFPQVSVAALASLFPDVAISEPQRLPARPRPASPNACPHCKGTAFCGRSWDADGMMVRGPVCAECKTRSGLAAVRDVDKVTCSHCEGKGFTVTAEEDATSVRRDAAAWRLRALALSDSGHYQPAIQAYTEAIRLAPDFADAYYERGWAYLAIGQNEAGDADLAEAGRLSTRYAPLAEQNAAPGAGDAGAANTSTNVLGRIAGLFRRQSRGQ
jgi:hypothetical protein